MEYITGEIHGVQTWRDPWSKDLGRSMEYRPEEIHGVQTWGDP
jgi:hypothetical protein